MALASGRRHQYRGAFGAGIGGPQSDGSGKNGSKLSVLVDERGVPLSLAVSGANRHDSVLLEPLLKERMTLGGEAGTVERNLCLDAGYVGREGLVRAHGFVPHIRPTGRREAAA